MARAAIKRKSEGSLGEKKPEVTQRTQTVAVTTNFGKHTTSDEDEDTECSLSITERAARSEKLSGGRNVELQRVSGVKEYEEDQGRLESQQFLSLAKIANENKDGFKANQFLGSFKKTVTKKEQDLIDIIVKHESQVTAGDIKFLECFSSIYSAALSETAMEHTHLTLKNDKNCHGLYKKSKNVIASAINLVQLFQNKPLCEVQRLSEIANWEIDFDETKHILVIGKEVGEGKVKSMLGVIKEEQGDLQALEVSGLLFKKHSDDSAAVTWKTVTRKQDRAIKRLMRALPQN